MAPDTILSPKGYVVQKASLSYRQQVELYGRLTVKPISHPDYPAAPAFPAYATTTDTLHVPRQWGLDHFGEPARREFADHICPNLIFHGNLRPNQMEAYETTIRHLTEHGTGVLSLPTGHGKTIITLALLAHLKQRACILVHKTHLLQQWKEQIATFLPQCKVGVVQGSSKTFRPECDIILVMIQTMQNISTDVPAIFGITVVDETHHLPSASFSKCMYKVNAKYLLGLSATPTRKDGLTKVLLWHMGEIMYEGKPDRSQQKATDVYFYKYDCHTLSLDPRRHADMITRMIHHDGRNTFIISTICKLLAADANRKRYILVLSERRHHATFLYEEIQNRTDRSCGLVLGGLAKEAFDIEKEKQIVFSTYQALSEGVDIQNLNTLILATPKADIIQSMGRIFRKVHTEVNPMIIDFVDSQLFSKSRKRLAAYKSELNGNLRVHDVKR